MKLITTGYEELDEYLGGGLVKNSTNLLVEDGKCLGELFLISMLRKRIENGDKCIIDCLSLTPEKVKDFCEKYDVSLKKYADSVHFVDLTGEGKNNGINLGDLDTFAPAYISFVSGIKAEHIFNIVLSLSDFTCRFGEEKTYEHLKENLKVYESCKRTAVYLIKRDINSDKYINRMKELCNSVILLKQSTAHDRFLSVEKSPLRKSSPELIRYNIGKELEKSRGVL
ncbi:MAG: hypothetical protein QMC80_04015 [Thermoplasmatales archaeon]|nr:hypothetical protein [Thermoplasmatales archaeon]